MYLADYWSQDASFPFNQAWRTNITDDDDRITAYLDTEVETKVGGVVGGNHTSTGPFGLTASKEA